MIEHKITFDTIENRNITIFKVWKKHFPEFKKMLENMGIKYYWSEYDEKRVFIKSDDLDLINKIKSEFKERIWRKNENR